MSYPYWPDPKRQSRRSGGSVVVVVATLALVGLGFGLGWLIFGRDENPSSQNPQPLPSSGASASVPSFPPASPTGSADSATTPIPAQVTDTAAPRMPTSAPETPRPTLTAGALLPPNWAGLQAQAFDLVNASRAEAGLQPVAWDDCAAQLAQAHAEDMLAGEFFSHWNRDGYGPDQRAALVAGMTDAVSENIHTYWLRFDDGTPAPIEDWPQRILDAHTGFMDSPGHRENILDPAHTHVGIGIAYRPDTGELRLVQEFVNRYVELDPLPKEVSVGDQATISGRVLDRAVDPVVNLAYEPFPQPLTREQLDQTGTYESAAEFFSAPRSRVDGQNFQVQAIFDANRAPGLYHVRVFVTVDGKEVLAASPIVIVR